MGESDLCSRLKTRHSMVSHARNTGGLRERELSTVGQAREGSSEVISKLQLEGAYGLHPVHEGREAWKETPEAT